MIAPTGPGGPLEFQAEMTQQVNGRWTATMKSEAEVSASGTTKERCMAGLRRALERTLPAGDRGGPVTIVVETLPALAGVAEAADVLGWDKRRVVTYIDRGTFPEPVQSLASGRVWRRADVEAYAADWRARHRPRKSTR
jgi:hypothetical protein